MGGTLSRQDGRAKGGEMNDRYVGKPFLMLLDSYVIDAVGAIDPVREAEARALEPQFGGGGWRAIVAREMRFPEGMAGAIREVWDKGRARFAEANGHDPDPAEFARIFVDTNFPR